MCGINGIVRFDDQLVHEEEIRAMNARIKHRGPDDTGVFLDRNIGLGHNRLSIIDLSPAGHQPMSYTHRGRTVVITYNGEFYDFRETRTELIKKGYTFVSKSDTEVILAAYLEYGVECLQKINGMFAFVIYDVNKKILFGARDRFGKKPFKYFLDRNRFIFSSELKAILENKVPREVDYLALNDFLTLQYVPAPRTGFVGISKLPHSHYFILDLKTRDFSIHRYYDLDFSKKLDLTETQWIEAIETVLDQAVTRCLVADVPVGIFLSGGVDSSAITMFMSRHTEKVRTFSITFDHKDFDERQYARRVANHCHAIHTEFNVDSKSLSDHLRMLVSQCGEPLADASLLPTYILSKFTREHVTVSLSGDAGDENFGGYEKYNRQLQLLRYHQIVKRLDWTAPLLSYASQKLASDSIDRLSIFLKTAKYDLARRQYNYTKYFDEFTKFDCYNPEIAERLCDATNPFESVIAGKGFSEIDQAMYLDFNTYIPDDINTKVDTASMANALEVRVPFLDYEFVNLTAQMPWQYKVGTHESKIILKKMLEKYLPRENLYRKKQGFSTPINSWFRNELKEYTKQVITDDNGLVLKMFKKDRIKRLLNDHFRGKDNSKKIWALLVLNLWYSIYFLQDFI